MEHDGVGIRCQGGDVLDGKLTTEEALKREALRAAWVGECRDGKKGTYASVTEYDPVLRAHCRIG